MIGRTLSRYRVVERLGEGGMGEVYRAHDERLDRDVALKILRMPRGSSEDRDRIRREARTLSQLSHPGISTIFDVESADGLEFLVMELVRGETLDRVLARGALDEARVRDVGAQIADALGAAHARGVIHRDLKPANVMVGPDGRVKLLDFGLALLSRGALPSRETTDDLTRDLVVGTLAYMSPEQLLGRALDERTDLYSLGVVLYEMATGRRPFAAEPATALINDVLNAVPRPPRNVAPAIGPALDRLILTLLDRDPAVRPATAAAVAAALRTQAAAERAVPSSVGPSASAPASAPSIGSIAVLPLANLTGAHDQEFFADGMTDALIGTLAQIHTLRVVSRTSVMPYKGSPLGLPEIARALDVDAVVEGAVARSAGRVRITAQLIDARRERHLWAQSYEREASDVLALQGEVARAIADGIRVTISPQDMARLGAVHRVDPEAYEEYLRGWYHWERRTEEGAKLAVASFERSILLDPEYAPAYAGLANVCATLGNYDFVPPREAFPRAEGAIARALELDDGLGEAYVALGTVRFNGYWDWDGAIHAYRKAIALAPNSAPAHHWYADVLSALGHHEEAIAEARTARTLDPLSLIVNSGVGIHFFYARRYDEAAAAQERTLELDPSFAPALRSLGGAYEALGRYDEAIDAYRRAHRSQPHDMAARCLLAHAYAVSGHEAEGRRLLAEIEEAARSRYVSQYALAAIKVGFGETDAALAHLERAHEARDRGMAWLGVSPRFDPLREDPRFRDLVRRMRLEVPVPLPAS
ncbi:MAG: protein kinase domain-containing protein [Hyphomicrobiales bacterium]